MDAAEQDLKGAAREVSGALSVGMAHSAVKAVGLPLIKTVLQQFPRLKLSISESLSGSALLHLMASEIDLAVVYNPPVDKTLRTRPVLEERMVCIGRRDIIGDTDAPLPFRDLLSMPLILLRQGLSARALLDDLNLLKKLESHAQLQLNSVSAIADCLRAGLGCAIGTPLFMREYLQIGELHARPIVSPDLNRTLYVCELADRPATFASERIRDLIVQLIYEAIAEGHWTATAVKTG